MKEEVLEGLRRLPKTTPAKYFYDERGSALFEEICALPEYYPTRTEKALLTNNANELLRSLGRELCLIELGAGNCDKGRLLLQTGAVSTFVPVDISTEHLRTAGLDIANSFAGISVHAVAMDFLAGLGRLEALLPEAGRRVLLYAGSSIGNFDPLEACALLSQCRAVLGDDGALLIGFDLKKDRNVLVRAYNDAQGVTAAFNLNLLARFNRELDADFDLNAFRHVAWFNEEFSRIEMHLESAKRQEVRVAGERVAFEAMERIHTENSYKYGVDGFDALAGDAGFRRMALRIDGARYFAVGLYGVA
ncbi:MAG TPA: L-histidine N(alpha)-methyltransferase [Clostridia bacterium]|nr:L-histidine N(alpha)-methyltransferase [Clostridia bacterium]